MREFNNMGNSYSKYINKYNQKITHKRNKEKQKKNNNNC